MLFEHRGCLFILKTFEISSHLQRRCCPQPGRGNDLFVEPEFIILVSWSKVF